MTSRDRTSGHGRARVTLQTYRRWAIAAFVGLVVIVPSGGLVRLTKSGLGCPDWPGCNGAVIPELSGHAAIEYSNRVLSFIVMVVAVITWVVARRLSDGPVALRRWSGAAALAAMAQIPLGGLTVMLDLHPLMVGAHFLLSLVALAPATVAMLIASDHVRGARRRLDIHRARVAGLVLGLLCAVIASGVVVTAAGPHSGDADVHHRFWDLRLAAMIHVRLVIAFVVVGVLAWVWLRRSRIADSTLQRLALVFAPLLATQIALGEYQYRNGLLWQVIIFHVTVAGLLFAVGTAAAWIMGHPPTAARAAADQAVGLRRQASSTASA